MEKQVRESLPATKEPWGDRVRGRVEEILELCEEDFFNVGDRYGVEQFLDDPESWGTLPNEERRAFLEALGECLGANLIGFSPEDVIRRYQEEGVVGEPSEGGATVQVLKTKFPELEVHVIDYNNPALGRRYDLVRAE